MKKIYILVGILVIIIASVVVLRSDKPKPTTSTPKQLYVALGDSVAAGVGLRTDSDSSACNRTEQSYPGQLAARMRLNLTNLACSGATLPAGILGNQEVNQLSLAPQIEQLFKLQQPDFVSLTIGANDADWTGSIGKCYTGECGTPADTAMVDQQLAVVSTKLQTVLQQIRDKYKKPPIVVVTGYHQVFPTDRAKCNDLMGIEPQEIEWGRQQQASLNDTIKQATSGYTFAQYVGVNYAGHELCSADSWVQGIADKQPYHPTEAGQAVFAEQIANAFKTRTR